VPPALPGMVIGAAVGWQSWRERLAGLGGAQLLADLAEVTSLFGFRASDEAV
jgi:hypothetical protein